MDKCGRHNVEDCASCKEYHNDDYFGKSVEQLHAQLTTLKADMDDYDKECFDRIQRIAELEAELERLNNDRKQRQALSDKLETQLAEFEAENTKLKEALTTIATSGFAYIDKAEEIAEAALNSGEKKG